MDSEQTMQETGMAPETSEVEARAEEAQQSEAVNWQSAFSEEFRNTEFVKNTKDIAGFEKQIQDLQSYQGQSIRIPSEEAGQEDWDKFYDKLSAKANGRVQRAIDPSNEEAVQQTFRYLGAPEDESGYELPAIEGIELPEERANMVKSLAHKANLTKTQLKTMAEGMLSADAKAMEHQQSVFNEGIQGLQKEWGGAFDDRAAMADRVRQEFFPQIDGPINAQTLQSLYTIAQSLGGEKAEIVQQPNKHSGAMTPDEASSRIGEIYANKEHPFLNKEHPDHVEWIRPDGKMAKLVRAAGGK